MTDATAPTRRYSYLGPAGTFTEAALKRAPEAHGHEWHPVANVGEALADVVEGQSFAAMIAIENSIDGGVTVAQDALATIPGLQIIGEYLVPVNFVLIVRNGKKLEDIRTIAAHPVAYGQCHAWLDAHVPGHTHLQAASNVQAAADMFQLDHIDAATEHYDVTVLAEGIAMNPDAVTRFVMVSKPTRLPERTGADKTSLIVELPTDRSGTLLELLEHFATRGVNLTLITSRPIGDRMGRYRFVIDAEGHLHDERVADALLGVKRFSPRVVFLGSYPRADGVRPEPRVSTDDASFQNAREWLERILSGKR